MVDPRAFSLLCVLAAACAQSARSPAAAPKSADLAAVMQRTHFAFRPRGAGFVAGTSTHQGWVGNDGAMQVQVPGHRALTLKLKSVSRIAGQSWKLDGPSLSTLPD